MGTNELANLKTELGKQFLNLVHLLLAHRNDCCLLLKVSSLLLQISVFFSVGKFKVT